MLRLLCQRHHTIVHDRRYVAEVRDTPDEQGRFVVWDRTHGSYDRHLERLRAERAVADPRPLTPDRVAELVAAIQADDPDDPGGAYWAKVELDHDRARTRTMAAVPGTGPSSTIRAPPEHRATGDGPCHHQEWARPGKRVPLP